MNFTKLLIAFFMMGFLTSKAQLKQSHEHDNAALIEKKLKSVQYTFDPDSLRGFNEDAAWEQARMGGGPDWEQKMQVSYSKRRYINTKYGVVQYSNQSTNPTVQAPCTNVDFENGTASGWTITEGLNSNSTTMGGCCPTASTRYSVVTAGPDPSVAALQKVPAGAGNYTLKIGDGSTTGGYAVRAKQTFSVSTSNSVFIYKFAVVLEDGGHTCSQQPYFNITFNDASNNPIPCGNFNVVQAGSGCSSGADPSFVTSGIYSYKNWTTRAFDLSSYIGQNVTVEFTASDCTLGGHAGWAYVDASCQPMTLNLNGTNIPVGQTNSASCGAVSNNTLCAPPGFGYTWTGPGVTGQTGQCVNAAVAGSYSVSLSITGTSCSFNPILYSTFSYSPNPVVTSSVTQPICANPSGSATITATSGTGPYTYSWTPVAPPTYTNTNLPTNTQYTVSATDANGCKGSTTFSINPYPPAPAYTLATVPGLILSCTTPTINMTFAASNASTTTQWAGPSGPITGTTTIISTPGIYTYTAINTVSTCSLTGSVNITGTIVYPVVTSTVTQPACSLPVGSATVAASGTTGPYTYSWTPAVALPYNTSNTNLPPGTSYTVSATDPSGCVGSTSFSVNNFSGAAAYTLTNIPGLPLTCPSPTTQLTFAPTNTNTTTQWTDIFGLPITGTTTIGTQTGVYSYTATNNLSGCTITGTIGVVSNIAQPSATPTVACSGGTIGLNASPADPEFTLNWASPTNTAMGNPATSTATAVFTLTVTDPLNGCTQTYTATSVHPVVSITAAPSTGSITCMVNSILATAVASPTDATISWNNGTSTSTVNPYPITTAGTYTTLVHVPNGCSTQSIITIGSNTAVDVSVTSPSTVISCATGSLALNAVSTTGGSYTYVWTPSSPTFTGNPYNATNSGTYTVVALNTTNGCTATATQAVSQETIDASFVANPYHGLMPLSVTFTNTSTNATHYAWDMGNSATYTTTNAATVYNTPGTYTVILTATNGVCRDTAMKYIRVDLVSSFSVPNVFTPNGDGKNDVFTFDAKNMGEINLTIFDRWGLKMFEATESGNVIWDGKNKGGNTVTDGTYFYIIKATGLDDSTYDLKGTISVFQ